MSGDARDVLAAGIMRLDGYGPDHAEVLAGEYLAALDASGLTVVPSAGAREVRFDGGLWKVIASDYDDLPTVTIRLRPVDGEA